jgi:hypothetical protein
VRNSSVSVGPGATAFAVMPCSYLDDVARPKVLADLASFISKAAAVEADSKKSDSMSKQ